MSSANIHQELQLVAIIHRADGTTENLGVIATTKQPSVLAKFKNFLTKGK
jgi:hypothetical protein